jgi:diguanylate cyclase (GGDEF)-like protein
MTLIVSGAARRFVVCLRRRSVLTRLGAWLVAVAVLAIGLTVWDLRKAILAEAFVSTDNLAIVLAEQTSRSVQAVDIVLRDIQERIATLGVTTPETFRRVLRTEETHEYLQGQANRLSQVDNLALVGADGVRVNYSIGWPAPAGDMSDREYTRHFAERDDPGLFISEPVVSRATGVWTMYLARRVNGPRGVFLGMVLGAVPLTAFSDLYRSIDLPRSESFLLLRHDGTIMAQHPTRIDRIGTKLAGDSPWYALVAQGGGHYEPLSSFDGATRLVAVRPLRDYPLVMNVGLSATTVLAHWRREAALIAFGTVCAAGGVLFLLRALDRQFVRLEKEQATLGERNAELTRVAGALQTSEKRMATTSNELEATLASMAQGLVMVDASGTVAVCNRHAIELLDLPAELMASRPCFDRVRPLLLLTDAVGGSGSIAAAWAATSAGGQPPSACERILPNGRTLEVRPVPLAGSDGWLVTYEDITARRVAEQKVVFMARHDALTLLPNRVVFRERIEAAAAQASRSVAAAAVLCLDLDYFKKVNDTLGHAVGDLLLCAVAERLCACVRQVDMAARFGGDEFAVVQVGPERVEDVAALAQRIIDVLGVPYVVDGHTVIVGVSVGIAMVPADGSDPDTLLKHADIALYRAKGEGRGAYRFFEPRMDARLQERRRLELELHAAMANDEFELFYQPLVDLSSDRFCGFEALIRWHHPTRGLVDPCEFIGLTEETGLIAPLGRWALLQACREAMTWPDDIRVAVNLSSVQFNKRDLVCSVTEALEDSGLVARRLELEIAEPTLLRHSRAIVGSLQELRNLGVRIAMDNFGTGYSSLRYMRSFPFDKIKIDKSFIRDLPDDKDALAIVRAVSALGSSLGMTILAEGVERPEQLAKLREAGCAEVQGYLFSVPRPASEIPRLLKRFQSGEPQAAVHGELAQSEP